MIRSRLAAFLLSTSALVGLSACNDEDQGPLSSMDKCTAVYSAEHCQAMLDKDNPRPTWTSMQDCIDALKDPQLCVPVQRNTTVVVNNGPTLGQELFMASVAGFMWQNPYGVYVYHPYPVGIGYGGYLGYRNSFIQQRGGTAYAYAGPGRIGSASGASTAAPGVWGRAAVPRPAPTSSNAGVWGKPGAQMAAASAPPRASVAPSPSPSYNRTPSPSPSPMTQSSRGGFGSSMSSSARVSVSG